MVEYLYTTCSIFLMCGYTTIIRKIWLKKNEKFWAIFCQTAAHIQDSSQPSLGNMIKGESLPNLIS